MSNLEFLPKSLQNPPFYCSPIFFSLYFPSFLSLPPISNRVIAKRFFVFRKGILTKFPILILFQPIQSSKIQIQTNKIQQRRKENVYFVEKHKKNNLHKNRITGCTRRETTRQFYNSIKLVSIQP